MTDTQTPSSDLSVCVINRPDTKTGGLKFLLEQALLSGSASALNLHPNPAPHV